jgi:hypothetical protein
LDQRNVLGKLNAHGRQPRANAGFAVRHDRVGFVFPHPRQAVFHLGGPDLEHWCSVSTGQVLLVVVESRPPVVVGSLVKSRVQGEAHAPAATPPQRAQDHAHAVMMIGRNAMEQRLCNRVGKRHDGKERPVERQMECFGYR